MVFNCQMCGAPLDVNEERIVKCEYCGSRQAVSVLSDERIKNAYNRACFYRRENEFDKALNSFERILEEDNTDPETYWSIVLCRYGVEYVVDPATGNRVPTIHRVSFKSILEDEDYKRALELSGGEQRDLYIEQANNLYAIQNAILKKTANEKPYDVFICFKDTDEGGNSTRDSLLATDIYHHITENGYRVFFSRISLSSHAGENYEPYIFAALNSAKVMVLVCTKKEYAESPWVKNEWKRFLEMMEKDSSKIIIPAYRDMSPYELPEELTLGHIQALDMSKIGFVNQLVESIKNKVSSRKDVVSNENKTTASIIDSMKQTDINRADTLLNLNDYESAKKAYTEISQKYPDDYRGWWGIIVASTQGLTKQMNYRDVAGNLDKYYSYVNTLAKENDSLPELKKRYEGYLKMCSAAWAYNVADSLKHDRKKAYELKVDQTHGSINDLTGRKSGLEKELTVCDELKRMDTWDRGVGIVALGLGIIIYVLIYKAIMGWAGGNTGPDVLDIILVSIPGLGGALLGGGLIVTVFEKGMKFDKGGNYRRGGLMNQGKYTQGYSLRKHNMIVNKINEEIDLVNRQIRDLELELNRIKEDKAREEEMRSNLKKVLPELFFNYMVGLIGDKRLIDETIRKIFTDIAEYYNKASIDIYAYMEPELRTYCKKL